MGQNMGQVPGTPMDRADILIEVRSRGMGLLEVAAHIPILGLFMLVARLVRFEWRFEGARRWHLAATAYDLIDWDRFDDDDDDDGRPMLTESALLGLALQRAGGGA